jgi:hypothetical protein
MLCINCNQEMKQLLTSYYCDCKMQTTKSIITEIESIIEKENLNCTVDNFADKVSWFAISYAQNLSEEFIEKFVDKVCWGGISTHQKLSEEFIEKLADKVDWYCITRYQKLSGAFRKKFADRLH